MSKPPCPMWISMGERNWQIFLGDVLIPIETKGSPIRQCFWDSACKWQRAKLEDTPILCSNVPTSKARCLSNYCTWSICHGCFLSHRLTQNLARKLQSNTLLTPILKCTWQHIPSVWQNMSSQLYSILEKMKVGEGIINWLFVIVELLPLCNKDGVCQHIGLVVFEKISSVNIK